MSADFLVFFLDEAVDILAEWEKACLELEQNAQKEAIECLYRGAHNLKSGAAAVGLLEFSAFIHKIEELLAKLLAGKLQSSAELIRLFLEVHTIVTAWFAQLRENPQYIPNAERLKVEAGVAKIACQPAAPAAVPPAKKAAPAAIKTTKTAPAAATPKPKAPNAAVVSKPKTSLAPAAETKAPLPEAPHAPATRQAETIRVASNKLDMLIQLVGELSTQQAIVWHARQNGALGARSCDNSIQLIQKNAKELQSLALSLRMQTLDQLFQRLERTAKDLARNQEKKLAVIAEGAHVELDRAVIERITEALTHVIRNAVDHGIEDLVERFDTGKNECATLRLAGSQEPGGILITISDDGRGMDLRRILRKATEKGLARDGTTYSDAEIQRFIFAPGFSTAEKVTDVSGRGVGMDVVKNAVQSIGGSIAVSSNLGSGTVFAISLPTTLSIVDALIVTAAGCRYAVPVQDVSEIIDLGSLKLEKAATHGHVVSLRSDVVPVEVLQDHLPKQQPATTPRAAAPSPTTATATTTIQPALLVRTAAGVVAFKVEHITGQQPVSLRPLPSCLEQIPGYTGGSILGDGEACIILNLPALVRLHVGRLDRPLVRPDEGAPARGGNTASASSPSEARYLVFSLGKTRLAVPLTQVREILESAAYAPVLRPPEHVAGCIEVRGQLLTAVSLAAMVGLTPSRPQGGPLVLMELAGQTFAVLVDDVVAVASLTLLAAPTQPSLNGRTPLEAFVTAAAPYEGQLISIVNMQRVLQEIDAAGEPGAPGSRQPVDARMGVA